MAVLQSTSSSEFQYLLKKNIVLKSTFEMQNFQSDLLDFAGSEVVRSMLYYFD